MDIIDPELVVLTDLYVDLYLDIVSDTTTAYRTTKWADHNGWELDTLDLYDVTRLWLVVHPYEIWDGSEELILALCMLCIDVGSVEDGITVEPFTNCLNAGGSLSLAFSGITACPSSPDEFLLDCLDASGDTGAYMRLQVDLSSITVEGSSDTGWFGSGGSWTVKFYATAEDCVNDVSPVDTVGGALSAEVQCAGVDNLGFQVLVRIPDDQLDAEFPGPYAVFSGTGDKTGIDGQPACFGSSFAFGGTCTVD